jgi:hypothetical protein
VGGAVAAAAAAMIAAAVAMMTAAMMAAAQRQLRAAKAWTAALDRNPKYDDPITLPIFSPPS